MFVTSLTYISTHSTTFFFFFFNDTATTEIYTLSLHDALPIQRHHRGPRAQVVPEPDRLAGADRGDGQPGQPLRGHLLQVPALTLQRVTGVKDEQGRARRARDLLGAGEHLEEERVGEVAHHEAVGGGPAPAQRL